MANNHPSQSERDRITGYFLPENIDTRERLSRETLDDLAAKLFGTETITKAVTSTGNPEEEPDQFLHYKKSNFYQVNYRYSRIFDLCRVIGAVNLYDIGCQSLNQSFQLVQYSRMSYTGIINGRFLINDYRPSDFETKNYNIIKAEETPPPLCDGRIRYIRGHYPEFELDVLPNNIAIACYSLTMYHEEEEIRKMFEALTHDFERILFNIRFRDSNVVQFWRNCDWSGFEIYPIGPQGFLFATKNPEDIRKLKEFYPFEDERFLTGIDDAINHYLCMIPQEPYRDYVEWTSQTIPLEDELQQKNKQREKEAFDFCQQKIAELGMDISLLSADYDAGRLTMVLYFRSESRVDELVKDLYKLVKEVETTLRVKVEPRQVL